VKAKTSAPGREKSTLVKATLTAGVDCPRASSCAPRGTPVAASTVITAEPTRVSEVFGWRVSLYTPWPRKVPVVTETFVVGVIDAMRRSATVAGVVGAGVSRAEASPDVVM